MVKKQSENFSKGLQNENPKVNPKDRHIEVRKARNGGDPEEERVRGVPKE